MSFRALPALLVCVSCSGSAPVTSSQSSLGSAAPRPPAAPREAASSSGSVSPPPAFSGPLAGLARLPVGPGGRLGGAERGAPEGVKRELEHLEKEYEPLPVLRSLPDFLSVNDVLSTVPEGSRESLRSDIHTQLAGGARNVLYGAHLDDEERYFLLWIFPDLVQTMVIYDDKGRITSRHEISRGVPYLRDVPGLQTARDAPGSRGTRELVIVRITSMSACCLPKDLEVYALSRNGKLARVFSFEKEHTLVGPGVRYSFMNHFEFNANGSVVVTRVYPVDSPGSWEFRYQLRSNRYEPTPETTRALNVGPARGKRERETPMGLDL